MRWITQKSIAPKESETVSDVVLDVLLALFLAAIATELLQIIFSIG
jgi:hypothetical protein